MDYFEKKQWIRIVVCVVLVAAIVLGMTGVFGGGKQLEYRDESAHPDEAETNSQLHDALGKGEGKLIKVGRKG